MAATQTPRFAREDTTRADTPTARTSADSGVGPNAAPSIGLLAGRVVVGFIMAAPGRRKLFDMSPPNFGRQTLDPLGVPAPVAAGYLVTFTELIGGLLRMAGLLTASPPSR